MKSTRIYKFPIYVFGNASGSYCTIGLQLGFTYSFCLRQNMLQNRYCVLVLHVYCYCCVVFLNHLVTLIVWYKVWYGKELVFTSSFGISDYEFLLPLGFFFTWSGVKVNSWRKQPYVFLSCHNALFLLPLSLMKLVWLNFLNFCPLNLSIRKKTWKISASGVAQPLVTQRTLRPLVVKSLLVRIWSW